MAQLETFDNTGNRVVIDTDSGAIISISPNTDLPTPPPLIPPGGPTRPPGTGGGAGPTPGAIANAPGATGAGAAPGGSSFDASLLIPPGLLEALAAARGLVNGDLRGALDNVNGIAKRLQLTVLDDLTAHDSAVSKALTMVQGQLRTATAQLGPNVVALVGAALGGVEGLVSAFLSNAADVADIAGAASAEVRKHQAGLFDFITGALGAGFGGGLEAMLGSIEGEHGPQLRAALSYAQNVPGLPDELRAALKLEPTKTTPFALLAGLAVILSVAGRLSAAPLSPAVESWEQDWWEKWPTKLLPPAELAELVQRDYMDALEGTKGAARQGISADQFHLLRRLRTALPPPGDVILSGWRGALNPGQVAEQLTHQGYNTEGQKVLSTAAEFYPGPSDLIHFLVRDIFTPAIVERFGQDQGYPAAFDALAQKAGVSPEVARWYWAAHWELPSTGQGFEMLQRGVIEPDDLDFLLRAADVMPFWREKLLKISYNPITRVDIRRLHKTGEIDFTEMIARYKAAGYAPDDANRLANFTVKLNTQERKDELAPLTDRVASRIEAAYIAGTLTEAQTRAGLAQLGADADQVNRMLQEATLARTDHLAATIADRLGDLYVNGHRTKAEASGALSARGFTEAEIAGRFQVWDLERDLHAPKATALADRDLTRADITAAMVDGILTKDQARTALTAMRYDALEVDTIIRLAQRKASEDQLRDETEIVHQRYRAGKMGELEAQAALDRLGIKAAHRDALMGKWTAERRTVNANVPVSTLGELYKKGIVSDAEVMPYLETLGYDKKERTWYLALWGSQLATAAAKLASAKAQKEAKANAGG